MTSQQIRESYLEFFRTKAHTIVESAPLVVKGDPTLMFVNAGMNQFKDVFLGHGKAVSNRVADSQKCLRVSGKHNDLEEVGRDTYHHTMFEMLGNWSFGDYFKKEAIAWAWEYLTDVLKIDKSRLYATVCEACPADGFGMDTEAYDYWKQYLPEDHILVGCKKDNFWEMGDTGPCGPCSELHYDSRSDEERQRIPGQDLVNKDDPRVIEIWNLVFMQYNRKADGKLELLPAKHVDTGMGFERLCRIVQGKDSNYDIDLFQTIIADISAMCGIAYGKAEETDIALRVVADHIRAISFSIADGQLPSNNKAGYVIRRLLRRAVRYAYTFLKQSEPFLCRVVPTLVSVMGSAYPELKKQQTLIEKVIREEEVSFLRTLSTGMQMLDGIIKDTLQKGSKQVSGESVFEMYDTYGFPLDLTELILRENNLDYDREAYAKAMEKQRERSRADAAVLTGDWVEISNTEGLGFVGYDQTEAEIRILKYRVMEIKGEKQYQLVFNTTPFYAESGGQVGDSGTINSVNDTVKILTTKKENNLHIHIADSLPEKLDTTFTAVVNLEQRHATEANHSGTHLLHYALRQVLGTHVEQKGSMVTSDSLRFDFSHYQKMSDEEIRQVERLVNKLIRRNTPLNEHRNTPIEEAKQMGAMALFGEKYGDKVRVIQFGESVEFCGGTHVHGTGEIGMLKIVSESAIAAGVRRIEAITGSKIEDYIYKMTDSLREVRDMFNNSPTFMQSIKKAVDENAQLKKQIEDMMREKASALVKVLAKQMEEVKGINIVKFIQPLPADSMKQVIMQLRNDYQRILIVGGSEIAGKPSLAIGLSDDLVAEGAHAGQIIKAAAKHIQGGGGGQAAFATAGGKNTNGLSQALEEAVQNTLAALKLA